MVERTLNALIPYKALNRLIQGSSADQTKQAMLSCYQAGYLPILQLHDELCFNVNKFNMKDVQEIKKNNGKLYRI